MAHKWARWLHNPCRLGGSPALWSGGQNQTWPTCGQQGYLGDPHRFKAGGNIRGGPQVGKVSTKPMLPWGSPPLQSGGQNRRLPTSGQGGYITPAAWGVPTASERGATSEVAHKWARCLHNPCCLGGPHRFRAGGRIEGCPQVGKVALKRWGPPRQQRLCSHLAHVWATSDCAPLSEAVGTPKAGLCSHLAHL